MLHLHIVAHINKSCINIPQKASINNCSNSTTVLHCVSKKNIPDVFSYNSRKHWRIFI